MFKIFADETSNRDRIVNVAAKVCEQSPDATRRWPIKKLNSILRALDILELACNVAGGISTTSLREWRGINQSTGQLILNNLAYKGFLEKYGTRPKFYRAGPAIAELRRVNHDRELLLKTGPFLLRISRQFNASIVYSVYIGGGAIGLLRATVQHPTILEMPLSYYLRPYGLGLVYQAFLSSAETANYRKLHPFKKWGKPQWKSLKQVDRYLVQARQDGYVVVGKGYPKDYFRVAAPIFGPGKSMTSAICLLKPYAQCPPEEQKQCIEAICQAAAELSYKPGGSGPQTLGPTPRPAVSRK